MRCEFVHEVPIGHKFPGLLVLRVKGILDKLEFIVQILVHELQPIEEIRIDDMQFGDKYVKLLEIYCPLAV